MINICLKLLYILKIVYINKPIEEKSYVNNLINWCINSLI